MPGQPSAVATAGGDAGGGRTEQGVKGVGWVLGEGEGCQASPVQKQLRAR